MLATTKQEQLIVEASDLRMTPVFGTVLLICSNVDPRHFYFN